MSAPTINIEENKKLFLDLVGSIERDGINELVAFLEKSDFFTAPASTRFHCSLPGGLALHQMDAKMIKKLAIPKICCGRNGLEWDDVRSMFEFVFADSDVQILVCIQ